MDVSWTLTNFSDFGNWTLPPSFCFTVIFSELLLFSALTEENPALQRQGIIKRNVALSNVGTIHMGLGGVPLSPPSFEKSHRGAVCGGTLVCLRSQFGNCGPKALKIQLCLNRRDPDSQGAWGLLEMGGGEPGL